MIAPAIYITYLLSGTTSFKKKIGHLIIGSVILIAVSFSWAAIVDLVPVQNRPYVGRSTNNSELELIIGHNGLERLDLSGSSNGGLGGDSKQSTQGTPGGNNRGEISSNGIDGNQQALQGGPTDSTSQDGGNSKRDDNMQPPNGGIQGGGPGGQGGLQGTFGA